MKRALVTGGSKGIGRAAVRRFAEEGYAVYFMYHTHDEEAEELSRETGAKALKCDVSVPEEVASCVRDLSEKEGVKGFDALIVNAGVSVTGQIQDLSDEEWERLSGVNLTGALNVIREASKGMIEKKSGSIVIMSSMWGRSGASCEAAYSATKAALIGLGQGLAKELGPSGIRVNMIAPGVIDTDMNKGRSEDEIRGLIEETPLGRLGKPEEVADLALFLCSEKASFITGQTIGIDGGFVV